MRTEICNYCGGSGCDAVIPTKECNKCHGIGTILVQDLDPPATPRGGAARRGASQYQMLPRMERIFDSIPRWLNLLFAVIGSGAGITVAQTMGSASHGSMAVFAVGGFLVGLIFLRLSMVLIDLTIQFTVGLVKLAIILAIFGGILFALVKWLGDS